MLYTVYVESEVSKMNYEEQRRMSINSAADDVLKQLKDAGYDVFSLVLQGSQNYGLDVYTDEYMSDFDFKAFVFPTLDDIYTSNKVSLTLTTPHGLVEVKDMRLLPELLGKMNPSYLELLASKFWFSDYPESWGMLQVALQQLVDERLPLLLKAMLGMAYEKQKALRHPYPSIVDKIAKYGYDPKQAHHIRRLLVMVVDMQRKGLTFAEALTPSPSESIVLMDIKLGTISSDEIDEKVAGWLGVLKEFVTGMSEGRAITSKSLDRIALAIKTAVLSRVKENLANSK